MIRWLLCFIPALIVEFVAWWLTPIVCLFVVKRMHKDKVKRLNRIVVEMEREFLPDWLSLFGTPDNAVDEYFWGMYSETPTQEQYLTSWWWRYYCRVRWLFRNTGYGFMYEWFSVPAEEGVITERGIKYQGFWWKYTKRPSSFQWQAHIPLTFGLFNDVNVGWKSHGFSRLMYANRVIGLRQYEA